MKYFRFRFGGEIAFRANEPPGEITLDLMPCTEDPVCVRGYLHRGGHEDKNGFVKPEDDEKMNNPQNGKRVRTAAQLRDTDGLLVHPDYLAARKPDTDATLVNAVPGYGGDVWRARHDDGDEAVYVIDEMEAL